MFLLLFSQINQELILTWIRLHNKINNELIHVIQPWLPCIKAKYSMHYLILIKIKLISDKIYKIINKDRQMFRSRCDNHYSNNLSKVITSLIEALMIYLILKFIIESLINFSFQIIYSFFFFYSTTDIHQQILFLYFSFPMIILNLT